MIGIAIVGIVAVAVAPYRLERIMALLDPWADPYGTGYQPRLRSWRSRPVVSSVAVSVTPP